MRIAFLDPTAQAGGAERVLMEIFAGLREARPDWALHATFGADGAAVSKVLALGAMATVLPLPPALARLGDAETSGSANGAGARCGLLRRMLRAAPETAGYIASLRRVLKQFAPDVIHGNGLKMDLLGIWARPWATPMLWHIHDHLVARSMMPYLMRLSSGACAGAIAISASVARELREVCGGGLKIFTVHNAVDLERFSPHGPHSDLDILSGLPPVEGGTIRVGLVATMARWKGQEVFLRALSMIPKDIPVRGYLIGAPIYQTDGSQYSLDELRSLAVDLGIADKVGFTGFVDDTASAMRALDVVVHASTKPEPFGLVIAEAMACGKAVIVSAAGGAAEIVSVGEDVLSHSAGDAGSLAGCIAQFVSDPALRTRFGGMARLAAERRFDRGRFTNDLISIYQQIWQSQN
jgi:glycosyltransferase involved in cell wall biosynthesis